MFKKIIAVVAVASIAITVMPAASASVSSQQATLAPTAVKDYSTKSKNQYWNAVRRLAPDARIVGKKSTIETGTLVCDLLKAGGDMYDLAELVADSDPLIEDFIIAAIAAAPVYLCRNQQYKFE